MEGGWRPQQRTGQCFGRLTASDTWLSEDRCKKHAPEPKRTEAMSTETRWVLYLLFVYYNLAPQLHATGTLKNTRYPKMVRMSSTYAWSSDHFVFLVIVAYSIAAVQLYIITCRINVASIWYLLSVKRKTENGQWNTPLDWYSQKDEVQVISIPRSWHICKGQHI